MFGDVFGIIKCYLPIKDIVVCAKVCRDWYTHIGQNNNINIIQYRQCVFHNSLYLVKTSPIKDIKYTIRWAAMCGHVSMLEYALNLLDYNIDLQKFAVTIYMQNHPITFNMLFNNTYINLVNGNLFDTMIEKTDYMLAEQVVVRAMQQPYNKTGMSYAVEKFVDNNVTSCYKTVKKYFDWANVPYSGMPVVHFLGRLIRDAEFNDIFFIKKFIYSALEKSALVTFLTSAAYYNNTELLDYFGKVFPEDIKYPQYLNLFELEYDTIKILMQHRRLDFINSYYIPCNVDYVRKFKLLFSNEGFRNQVKNNDTFQATTMTHPELLELWELLYNE